MMDSPEISYSDRGKMGGPTVPTSIGKVSAVNLEASLQAVPAVRVDRPTAQEHA